MHPIFSFLKDIRHTGAVAPSSEHLVSAVSRGIRECIHRSEHPLNILELGPGTGVITKAIVESMRPDDHLEVVELNQQFYQFLKMVYRQPNVHIHHLDVLAFEPGRQYDLIISSIPYESLPSRITTQIWKKKLALGAAHTHMMYYKYLNPVAFRSKYEKLMVRNHLVHKEIVWRNMPPATVYTLEVSKNIIFAA